MEMYLTGYRQKILVMSLSYAMFMLNQSVRIAMQDFIVVEDVRLILIASTALLQILMISVANFKKRELSVQ